MAFTLKAPDKKMKFTKEELQYLIVFLNAAKTNAFTRIHNYHFAKDREELYQYHLLTISEKIIKKLFRNESEVKSKIITIRVNFGEEKTLIVVFRRIDCGAKLLDVESRIMFGNVPAKILRK